MALRLTLSLIVALTIAGPAAAQTARNAAYGELLGNAVLYSANYERRFTQNLWARIGIGGIAGETEEGERISVVSLPLMVNYLSTPLSNHHAEFGIGVVVISGENVAVDEVDGEEFSGATGTATIGYRYQRPTGGFVFRAGFTPFFGGDGFFPSVGVSFGGSW